MSQKPDKKLFIFIGLIFAFNLLWVIFMQHYLKDPTWTLTQHGDDSGNQGLFYTVKNEATGELMVIDGGWEQNADHVRNVIKENGGVVSCWIITHYHNDHVNAFNKIFADPQGIEIKKVYCPDVDKDAYDEVCEWWDYPECYDEFLKITSGFEGIVHPKRGENFSECGLNITFFNTYDDKLKELTDGEGGDMPNNTSLVFKISGNKDSALFFADTHGEEMSRYFEDNCINGMKDVKFIQAGHHGNNSLTYDFYEKIKPQIMFFDAQDFQMIAEEFSFKDYAAWCDKNGVERYDYSTAPNVFIVE